MERGRWFGIVAMFAASGFGCGDFEGPVTPTSTFADAGDAGSGSESETSALTTGISATSGTTSTSDPTADASTTDVTTSDSTTSDTGDATATGDPMCPNFFDCPTAPVIGDVSGDVGSQTIVETGDGPTWVTFLVTENDEAVQGQALSARITLESPPGLDFDMVVYRGIEGAANGCGGQAFETMSASSPEFVMLNWGEGGVANGVDDDAWIAVEVRVKNDTCESGVEWTLTAEGNA